jgi:hypothetical protein
LCEKIAPVADNDKTWAREPPHLQPKKTVRGTVIKTRGGESRVGGYEIDGGVWVGDKRSYEEGKEGMTAVR